MQLFSYFRSWITFKNCTSTWLLTPFSSTNSKKTIQQVKPFWINVKGCNKLINIHSLSTVLVLIGSTKCIANPRSYKCRFISLLCHNVWCTATTTSSLLAKYFFSQIMIMDVWFNSWLHWWFWKELCIRGWENERLKLHIWDTVKVLFHVLGS